MSQFNPHMEYGITIVNHNDCVNNPWNWINKLKNWNWTNDWILLNKWCKLQITNLSIVCSRHYLISWCVRNRFGDVISFDNVI